MITSGTALSSRLMASAAVAVGVMSFACLPNTPEQIIVTSYRSILSSSTRTELSKAGGTLVSPNASVGSAPWVPKTELGRKLADKRAAVLASGIALLSMDEINAELHLSRRSPY